MNKDVNKYYKGSEWRKWDLHVHTPSSIVQNYGGETDEVWKRFITELESLPPEFKVIGINDYLFLDGYKKVLEYQKSGRLKNLDLILPVLEFRIMPFAGVDFGTYKRPNIHVIFSNQLKPEDIENEFINQLQIKNIQKCLSKQNLIEFGKTLINKAPDNKKKDYGSPLIEGFNNLNLLLDEDIKKLLSKDCFCNKHLLAIGKTEWSEIKWKDGSISDKHHIINSCHVVFTASTSENEYNRAKNKLTEEKVNNLLLDCSDAHSFSDSDNKDRIGNCMTWIKADPTFDGLKIALLNSEERIYISVEEPKDLKNQKQRQDKIIHKIKIDKPSDKNPSLSFQAEEIEFNSGLVAIIGNQGGGKSALLDVIARGCGYSSNKSSFSFLNSDRFFEDIENKSFTIKLKSLGDGDFHKVISIDTEEQPDFQPIQIDYITQEYLRNLEKEKNNFMDEVNKILFTKAKVSHDIELASYQDYKEYQNSTIDSVNYDIDNSKHDVLSYLNLLKQRDIANKTLENELVRVINNFNDTLKNRNKCCNDLKEHLEKNQNYQNIKEESEYVQSRINEINKAIKDYTFVKDKRRKIVHEIEALNSSINNASIGFIRDIKNAVKTFNENKEISGLGDKTYCVDFSTNDIKITQYLEEIAKLLKPSKLSNKIKEVEENDRVIQLKTQFTKDSFIDYKDIVIFFNSYKQITDGNLVYLYKSESQENLNYIKALLESYQNILNSKNKYITETQKTIQSYEIRCNKLFGIDIFTNLVKIVDKDSLGLDVYDSNESEESIFSLFKMGKYFKLDNILNKALDVVEECYKIRLIPEDKNDFDQDILKLSNKISISIKGRILEILKLKDKYKILEYHDSPEEKGSKITIKYKPNIVISAEDWMSEIARNRIDKGISETIDSFYKSLKLALAIDNTSIDEIANKIVNVIMKFTIGSVEEPGLLTTISSTQLKKSSYIMDYRENIITNIFGLKYITFKPFLYLTVDDREINIQQMSLGQKTEAILKLYLQAGNNSDYPILIDQPENNLENKVMSKNISKLLKNASKRRQIFVVTHSPNIAILSNADQIIKAELIKDDGRYFKYTSGSIENNGISSDYIDVLEGGLDESFNIRKESYYSLLITPPHTPPQEP